MTEDPFAWQRKREERQGVNMTEAQRWRTDVLEELRGIRKALEEANGREVEYYSDGKTVKRVRVGLCGWAGPVVSNMPSEIIHGGR